MNRFRGKSLMSLQDLDEKGIKHKDGLVIGYLVGSNILVGEVNDLDENYIVFDYWVKVDKYTLEKVGDL